MKNITFLNAGAGSGKTYKLTELIYQDISNGSCKANEIILTTFTKVAAAEFKIKATEKLIKEGLINEAAILQDALIGTVHSVAERLIKKFWFKLGISPEMNVIEVSDRNFFISQAMANEISEGDINEFNRLIDFFPLTYSENFIEKNDYNRWKTDLSTTIDFMLVNRINDLSQFKLNNAALIESIFGKFNFDFNLSIDEIKSQISAIRQFIAQEKDTKTKIERLEMLDELLSKNEVDYQTLKLLRNSVEKLSSVKKYISEFPMLSEWLEKLNYLYSHPDFIANLKQYASLIYSNSAHLMEFYLSYKKTNKLLDFSDMEFYFLSLLDDEDVVAEIKNTFKRIYVDEFQDSSPIQFMIFSRLSEMVEKSYWVGDPKQSIYGFRGTDPELINQIVNSFLNNSGSENLEFSNVLDKSWRSRASLVTFVNQVFVNVFQGEYGGKENIMLKPVIVEKNNVENTYSPLLHWHFDKNQNKGIAKQIKDLLDEKKLVIDKEKSKFSANGAEIFYRPIEPKDIAVLCLNNHHIKSIVEELKNFNLEINEQDFQISNTVEFELLRAAIQLFQTPGDQFASSAILNISGKLSVVELIDQRLRHLAVNENDFYGNQWLTGNEDFKVLSIFDSLRKANIHPLAATIKKVVIISGLFEILEQWENGEHRSNNLLRMINQADKYVDYCRNLNIASTLNGFVNYLSSITIEEKKAPSLSKGINVLTYHSAKGLEWPVVVLLDLDNEKLDGAGFVNKNIFGTYVINNGAINLEDPFEGKMITVLPYPLGSIRSKFPENYLNDLKKLSIYDQIYHKTRSELSRLLYVGFTRARDVLITVSEGTKASHLAQDILGWEENSAEIIKENLYHHFSINVSLINFKSFKYVDADVFDEIETSKFVLRFPEHKETNFEPKYISPSELKDEEAYSAVQIADFKHRIALGKSKVDSAALGSCIHEIFAIFHDDLEIQKAQTIINNHFMNAILTDSSSIILAAKNLFTFLRQTYGNPVKIYRELPVQMMENLQIISGEIDLLWETESDLILVDYKTFPGRRDDTLNPASVHYAGFYGSQLMAYDKIIKASQLNHKKVIAKLIYYAVGGYLVKIT